MTTRSVLLVEDYPANALVGSTYITHKGFACDIATTAEDARRLAKSKDYAVIFMDVRIGDECGLELTRELREWEKLTKKPRRKIIAMTADVLRNAREKCLEAGMDDYLSKPFLPQDLYSKLEVA